MIGRSGLEARSCRTEKHNRPEQNRKQTLLVLLFSGIDLKGRKYGAKRTKGRLVLLGQAEGLKRGL